jgi:hypothetical protein
VKHNSLDDRLFMRHRERSKTHKRPPEKFREPGRLPRLPQTKKKQIDNEGIEPNQHISTNKKPRVLSLSGLEVLETQRWVLNTLN